MIDLGRGFRAPFDDPDWVSKTLLSFVWGLLGILFFPLLAVFTGVEIEYIRRVRAGNEQLPDWSNFGRRWTEGLAVWIASFLYFLPVFVLGAMAFAPTVTAALKGEQDLVGGLLIGSACLYVVAAIVYTIVVSILYQAALVNYAVRGGFGSLFSFGEILRRVRGGTGYWTAWAYTVVISFVVSAISGMLGGTIVGALLFPPALYLGAMMTAHVLGQWARASYGAGTPGSGRTIGSGTVVTRTGPEPSQPQVTPPTPTTPPAPPKATAPPEPPAPVTPPPPPGRPTA